MQVKVQKLLHSFFGKFELQSFAKGEIIIKPGENQRIFFLASGVVKMSSLSKKGVELTLNIYKPHALFPVSLIFNHQNKQSLSSNKQSLSSNKRSLSSNKYRYRSLTRAQGYFAPKKDFAQFLKKNPDVLFDLLKRIYRGLDGSFVLLEALLLGDAFYRVLTQLVIHARRFGINNQDRITFDWHLTHEQLASQTGLARESVTKEVKKLQAKGLIGYSGKKVFIYDLPKLEEECFSYVNKAHKKLPLDNPREL